MPEVIMPKMGDAMEEETLLKWLKSEGDEVSARSEEHTSELQSRQYLVCRLLLEKKKSDIHSSVTRPTTPSFGASTNVAQRRHPASSPSIGLATHDQSSDTRCHPLHRPSARNDW